MQLLGRGEGEGALSCALRPPCALPYRGNGIRRSAEGIVDIRKTFMLRIPSGLPRFSLVTILGSSFKYFFSERFKIWREDRAFIDTNIFKGLIVIKNGFTEIGILKLRFG